MLEIIKNRLIGKIVTITTLQVNFRFKEEQMMDYFMGKLISADKDCLVIENLVTKCISCIAMQYVVSINEEQVVYDSQPEFKEIIDEYRKEKPISAAKTIINPNALVDPLAMANLAKKAKESFANSTKS